ncbi:MAG: 16S rRNA (cytidine(1402)-2'-O)-methyltransferase [Candidatus Aminicenantes bacterium]|nr:16S rRNA (cytidine(1402)-2'-O)-methyltransferase [Candidatus Aminicenantes bacterium]NIM78388.1 16S rRNA (cytidine(1402)-2'-O)-methyltransferase [Candidatus Aminicenantes bacterium]NIN17650.1 16S rRNA (cytidine(1402)-2'-O)-methyltransferase [Candidatus Aminicenantes bacterium]NIN41526.1 16S rRNA (cytidine(1402)-2'-O)-methyltransferase [Candidatus Aminicenantes bacterium]NIN84300.1 16S rRNA (cytidine(1402)-2'-O)-methyltransferase [Candidatus Aminicenantes bacterium]
MDTDKRNGTLYIISTPIGNMDDITYRAVKILGAVDALACEDTRHTRKILSRYQIPLPNVFFSYHEHNEAAAGQKILNLLKEGKEVALCSDAGTPGISDPGYRIISEAVNNGYHIDIIPGASAVTSALLASGLPTSSFTFKGFPPRKKGPRKKFLEMEKEAPHTLIFFESPYRVGILLADAFEILGNRLAAVCMDLTKMYEKVCKGYLEDLVKTFANKDTKGEVTVIIAGNNPKFLKK